MPDMFGGGNDTVKTTSESSQSLAYPGWTQMGNQALAGLAMGLAFPHIKSSPYSRAGFNLDQQKGFDLARDAVNQFGFGTDNLAGARGMIGQAAGMAGAGGQSEAAQLGPTDYQQFMNPFLETALQPATDELQRQTDIARAQNGAQSAAAGAYGGSRGALRDAQLDRSMGETASRLVADTMAQGYDRATGLASQNVDRQQQTNLANASNSIAGAGTMLQGAGMLDNFLTSDFNRGMSSLDALLETGRFQQEDAQKTLNDPYEKLAFMAQFFPDVTNYTQLTNTVGEQPDGSPSFLQSLLGIGGKAAFNSLFPGLGG